MRIGRVLAVWALFLLAMIVQGAAREGLLAPLLGELRAHQASSVTAALILILGSAWALRWLGAIGDVPLQLRIGALWLALTVAFELGFGHFVLGQPWSRLLADYDLGAGRLFPLVLAATAFGPFVAGRFVGPRPPP